MKSALPIPLAWGQLAITPAVVADLHDGTAGVSTKFWKAALGVAGIAPVCLFVLTLIYLNVLKLPIFSTWKKDHQFRLEIRIVSYVRQVRGQEPWRVLRSRVGVAWNRSSNRPG